MKFWNFTPGSNRNADTDAEVFLERTVQTHDEIRYFQQIPNTEVFVTYGDQICLFYCHIRSVSDRKLVVNPSATWALKRSKPVGLAERRSSWRCWALSDGHLHTFSTQFDKKSSPRTNEHAAGTKEVNYDDPDISVGKTLRVDLQLDTSYRKLTPYRSLLHGSVRDTTSLAEETGVENIQLQGSRPAVAPVHTEPFHRAPPMLTDADDDDDDLAVIAGEGFADTVAPEDPVPSYSARLCGASFAPSGLLVRFDVSFPKKLDSKSGPCYANFRGVSDYLSLQTFGERLGYDDIIPFDTAKPLSAHLDRFPAMSDPPNMTSSTENRPALEHCRKSSAVFLNGVEDILQASQDLAKRYSMSLDQKHYAALLLKPIVPLKRSTVGADHYVEAKRNLVEIKRRDRRGKIVGTDTAFDEPREVTEPSRRAPVVWVHHPFGRALARKLLRLYQERGDVQMLAMLVTVFALHCPEHTTVEQRQEVEAGRAKVKFKNLDKFGTSRIGRSHRTLLYGIMDPNAIALWRQNYAEQLYAWGLHLERSEMLRAVTSLPSAAANEELSTVSVDLTVSRARGAKPICSICYELVQGYCTSRSSCGQTCHATCMEAMAQTEPRRDIAYAMGCNCDCTDDDVP
ncbi:MAG: hypothetical protein Q9159_005523 [Coniocarpon cinnabarinum]